MPRPDYTRYAEDLTDLEVHALKRLGMKAAWLVQERFGDAKAAENTRMEFLERYMTEQPDLDRAARRFAVAQAALFLSRPELYDEYVPSRGLNDEEWVRFMVAVRGVSDADLAFQIARAEGHERPDMAAVERARERLGLGSNQPSVDADTLAILRDAAGQPVTSRMFLTDREWLRERVEGRDWSDGRIADELARIGAPCDRSTVRLYRQDADLVRPSYRDGGP